MVDKAKLDQMLSNLRVFVAVLKDLAKTPDIDDRRVYEYLQESPGDLSRFAQAIAERFQK